MVSFYEANASEFICMHLLPELRKISDKNDMGSYRDDGLITLRKYNMQKTEKNN